MFANLSYGLMTRPSTPPHLNDINPTNVCLAVYVCVMYSGWKFYRHWNVRPGTGQVTFMVIIDIPTSKKNERHLMLGILI
jgi:hypothetical protein